MAHVVQNSRGGGAEGASEEVTYPFVFSGPASSAQCTRTPRAPDSRSPWPPHLRLLPSCAHSSTAGQEGHGRRTSSPVPGSTQAARLTGQQAQAGPEAPACAAHAASTPVPLGPAGAEGRGAQVPGVPGPQAPGAWAAHGPSGTCAIFKEVRAPRRPSRRPLILLCRVTSSRFGKRGVISPQCVRVWSTFQQHEPQRFPGPSESTPSVSPVVQGRACERASRSPVSGPTARQQFCMTSRHDECAACLPLRLREGRAWPRGTREARHLAVTDTRPKLPLLPHWTAGRPRGEHEAEAATHPAPADPPTRSSSQLPHFQPLKQNKMHGIFW